jgi:capsular exopolysaccharide synthesis family protein
LPVDYQTKYSKYGFSGSILGILKMREEVLVNQVEEEEIDLRAYWEIFNKYKGRIFMLTLLIGILTTLFVSSLPTIYRSTARLLIESDKPNVISIEEIYNINIKSKDYFETQLEILKSRALAKKVVQTLNLTTHPEFDPVAKRQKASKFSIAWRRWLPSSWLPPEKPEKPPSAEATLEAIVGTFRGHLSISPVRNTQIVEISFEAQDAKLAAEVPNTVADSYIEADLDARLQMTKKASALLNERITELRQNLGKSERALQDYLEKNNLVDVSGIKSMTIREIEETSSNLVQAQRKLMEISNIYGQIKSLPGKSPAMLESIPVILSNPTVQEQKAQELATELKVSELSERYGNKHPAMLAVQSELKMAKSNTLIQIKKVVDSIKKEYQIAEANVIALKQVLQESEKRLQEIGHKEHQLKLLEREISINRQLYDMFLTRFKETDVSQDVQALESIVGRVIDYAIVSSVPYKPQKKRIVIISLVLGFLFTTMLAFLLEYLDNTLESGDDVEQKLKVPFLGLLPKIKIKRKDIFKPELMFLHDQKSAFAEAVRTTRTGIMLSGTDGVHQIFVVTSSLAGEGKTTVSINQACALAQMTKTLLIDADLRRPSIAKVFSLDNKTVGLAELVTKTASFSECIHSVGEGGLDIIPSGVIPLNHLELISSQRFRDILRELNEHYENIVIDSAPLHVVSDGLVLSRYANGTIYVVKADSTPHTIVASDLKRLRQTNTPLLGVVLNHLDLKKVSRYYKDRYDYKSYYYGSHPYS